MTKPNEKQTLVQQFRVPECSSFYFIPFFLLDYSMVLICAAFKKQGNVWLFDGIAAIFMGYLG